MVRLIHKCNKITFENCKGWQNNKKNPKQTKTNPNQNCLFIPTIERAFYSNEKLLAQNHYIRD